MPLQYQSPKFGRLVVRNVFRDSIVIKSILNDKGALLYLVARPTKLLLLKWKQIASLGQEYFQF